MKILQVIPSLAYAFGGPTNAVLGLSFALARKAQDVTIFTTDADVKSRLNVPLDKPVDLNGVKIFYFPVCWFKHYKFSPSLARALKENISGFDIVHIHSLFQFSTLAAAYYCRKENKPYVLRPLGQLDPFLLKRHFLLKRLYLQIFELNNLEHACALHFTTEEEKVLAMRAGIKSAYFIVPLGINLEEFNELPKYGTFRSRYPSLKDKKIILFLSRINFKKGLDILVKAFSILARERDDAYLVIAGPDNEGYSKKVKKWLTKEKILNKVVFSGMLLGQDKLAAFRDSDIFVLPSYSENLGLAVVEAMASGLPVIVSDKVNISSSIIESKAGLVVDTDPLQLSNAIERLLDEPQLRKELGERAKNLVRMRFAWEQISTQLLMTYQSILSSAS